MKKTFIFLLLFIFSMSLASADLANIGKINIDSEGYEDLDKEVWIIDWIETGGKSENLRATILPSDFKKSSGTASKQSFTIGVNG